MMYGFAKLNIFFQIIRESAKKIPIYLSVLRKCYNFASENDKTKEQCQNLVHTFIFTFTLQTIVKRKVVWIEIDS